LRAAAEAEAELRVAEITGRAPQRPPAPEPEPEIELELPSLFEETVAPEPEPELELELPALFEEEEEEGALPPWLVSAAPEAEEPAVAATDLPPWLVGSELESAEPEMETADFDLEFADLLGEGEILAELAGVLQGHEELIGDNLEDTLAALRAHGLLEDEDLSEWMGTLEIAEAEEEVAAQADPFAALDGMFFDELTPIAEVEPAEDVDTWLSEFELLTAADEATPTPETVGAEPEMAAAPLAAVDVEEPAEILPADGVEEPVEALLEEEVEEPVSIEALLEDSEEYFGWTAIDEGITFDDTLDAMTAEARPLETGFGWVGLEEEAMLVEEEPEEEPVLDVESFSIADDGFGWMAFEPAAEAEEKPAVKPEAPTPAEKRAEPLSLSAAAAAIAAPRAKAAPAVAPAVAEAPPTPVVRELTPEELEHLDALRAQVREEPRDFDTWLTLARELWQVEIYDEALDAYSELLNAGQLVENVVDDMETHCSNNACRPNMLRVLGDAYMRVGRTEDALHAYQDALRRL
ncbi:MAG: hypothetical protein JXD18_11225, partial [Anaerolineae bacterium]|nr:hypothetical protein [Anaerolineae bacterium]